MQRAKFKYLPHTADIAFVAYGKSFEELLENSAMAMLGLMFDLKAVRRAKAKARTLRITERATSMDDALWFTLQKIVSKVDGLGVYAFRFKVNGLAQRSAGIVVRGCVFYKRMPEYAALLDVKGVTPHGLAVRRGATGYSARVLVDV